MRNNRGFELIEALIVLAVVAILALVIISPFYACPTQWEKAGLRAEFTFLTGCMVQRKDGTWIPAKALRDINL
jgi:prepilin-type N-terminal cleavage/methylation domain-containing protein